MKLTGLRTIGYALIIIYLWPPDVAAAIVNRTIDDVLGDSVTGLRPIYSPAKDVWNDQTCGRNKCAINPVVDQAFDGTYTAATYHPAMGSAGICLHFNGTAIYVFFILANYQGDGITTLTSANFTVDGNPPVPFTYTPDPSTILQYNSLVFSRTDLTSAAHTLNISITGSESIYVNFDYAIYSTHNDTVSAASLSPFATTSTSQKLSTASTSQILSTSDTVSAISSSQSAMTSTSQKSSTSGAVPYNIAATAARTPVGTIVGGTAGAIVVIVLAIFLLFCWRRRRAGQDAFQMDMGKGSPAPWITDFKRHHGAIGQRDNGNECPAPLIIEFNGGPSPSAVSAPGMSYTQPPVHSKASMAGVIPQLANQIDDYSSGYSAKEGSDYESNVSNDYQTLCSGQVVLDPPGSARPSSSTSKSSGLSTRDKYCASRTITSPNIGTEIQEDICCTRQELDNQLRMLQQEMLELQELSVGPRGLVPLKRRTAGEVDFVGEEADMPVPNMNEVIQSLKEQIQVLRE